MKLSSTVVLVIMVGLNYQISFAGSISDSYSSGDTLKASHLNNIKSAVNDSDTKFTSHVSDESAHHAPYTDSDAVNAILNTADVVDTVQILDGAVTGTKLASGFVSVPAPSFDPHKKDGQNACNYYKRNGAFSFRRSSSDTNAFCDAVAGIQIPDGVTLSRMDCGVNNTDTVNTVNVQLIRSNIFTGIDEVIFETNISDNSGLQTLADPSPIIIGNRHIVDNSSYAYRILANYSTNDFSITVNTSIFGCRVGYN